MKNEITLASNLIKIIDESRQNALRKVNEELIRMYWQVGEFLSNESKKTSFGDSYIDAVASEIQDAFPGIIGQIICLFYLGVKLIWSVNFIYVYA